MRDESRGCVEMKMEGGAVIKSLLVCHDANYSN